MTISIYKFSKDNDLSKATVQRRVKTLGWPTDQGLTDEQQQQLLAELGSNDAQDAPQTPRFTELATTELVTGDITPAGSYDFGDLDVLDLTPLTAVTSMQEQRQAIARQLAQGKAQLDAYDQQLAQLEIQKAAEDAYNHELAKTKAREAAVLAARKQASEQRARQLGLTGNG